MQTPIEKISSTEVVYNPIKKRSNPTYQLEPHQALEGTAFAINETQNSRNITFRIPSNLVFNLSESILSFAMTFVAGGDDGGGNDYYNFEYITCVPFFSRIQLRTKDGLRLVDVDNAHYASEIMNRVTTRITNFETNNIFEGLTGRTGTDGVGQRPDGTNMSNRYEHMYINEATTANAATPNIGLAIYLKDLLHYSLLELNKDLYFGKEIELVLSLNSRDYVGYKGISLADISDGATSLTDNIAITGLQLYLAVEKDESIINDLMSVVDSPNGLQLQIPFPTVLNSLISLSSDHSHEHKIFNDKGQRVLCVMSTGALDSSEFAASPNCVYTSLVSLAGGNVLEKYRVEINNKRIQLDDINMITSYDAYLYNRDYIKGSHLQLLNPYEFNWYHVEDFTGLKGENRHKLLDDNIVCGHPIDKEFKFRFIASGSALVRARYYHVFVTQRLLTVKKNQVTLD